MDVAAVSAKAIVLLRAVRKLATGTALGVFLHLNSVMNISFFWFTVNGY